MIVGITLLASLFAAAQAGCDNSCSGHGTCGLDGVCTCFDNWGMGLSHDSGDCSDRICPYEIAWADAPDSVGTRHRYAECAGRGVCDRETGNCDCFPGYEGKACARATCPNSCSGHGQCKYIQNLPYQVVSYDYFNNAGLGGASGSSYFESDPHTFTYYGWDNGKSRACVCDPQWGDIDCSKRMCPYGTDIMDHRANMNAAQVYNVQTITLEPVTSTDTPNGNTFALTFTSKLNETFTTIPIVYDVSGTVTDFQLDVQTALKALPNNVIDDCTVTVTEGGSATTIAVTFTGSNVQGNQFLLGVSADACGDGCTPKLTGLNLQQGNQRIVKSTSADYNSYECGRRGKCNYDTGVCECFAGYTGAACGTITALV